MKYLLDVNVLLAAIWDNHPQHGRAFAWLSGKSVLLCPLCELGFLRISSHPKALNVPMEKARQLLKRFSDERNAGWIADDISGLQGQTKKSEMVTDMYLAELASKHGAKLATFDGGISHAAVEVCS
jgi:toxin-antitoxin system PIN domain toxin